MTAGRVGDAHQVRIPLPDSGFLAATLYLPAYAGPQHRVPVLLEALPYRKDDLTWSYRPEYVRFRDEHDYAVARVDLRGTGSSPGVALDEYHPQEQADLHVVIEWLAVQEWSTGAVGMFGTSWSGFNALQLACERPRALKAVVATYATDDRWSDDVHYMGGALRLLDQVDYPLYMVAMNGLPPVPELFGEGWREEWLRRVEDTPPWLLRWLTETTDGTYWRHGSLRARPGSAAGTPSYERIACPTLLVAGWADGYRDNTFRTFRGLDDAGTPVHVLAGPWSHMAPATSVPGPGVDQVVVMARWWDRWLRGLDNGVDAEPPLSVFVRRYAEPEPDAPAWPGTWQAHDRASLDAVRPQVLPFASGVVCGAVADGAVDERRPGVVRYAAALDVGAAAWNSCAASLPWGQPLDQRADDARSLCVEWAVPAGTVVLGHPVVRVRVRPDGERTHVSAKLSLVPDGGGPSLLVCRGLLDLAYREGDGTAPRPLVPGAWVDVAVECEATAFEVTEGYRLRLALASADWPNTVAPQGVWSALDCARSELELPVSPGTPHPAPVLPEPAAQVADVEAGSGRGTAQGGDSSHVQWRHGYDILTRTRFADVDHGSSYAAPFGARCTEHYVGHVEVDARTGEQVATGTARFTVAWPDVAVQSTARLLLRVGAGGLVVDVDLDVDDLAPGADPAAGAGGVAVARRRWQATVPRRSV